MGVGRKSLLCPGTSQDEKNCHRASGPHLGKEGRIIQKSLAQKKTTTRVWAGARKPDYTERGEGRPKTEEAWKNSRGNNKAGEHFEKKRGVADPLEGARSEFTHKQPSGS